MSATDAARIYFDMSRIFGDPDQLAAYYSAMQPDCTYIEFLAAILLTAENDAHNSTM